MMMMMMIIIITHHISYFSWHVIDLKSSWDQNFLKLKLLEYVLSNSPHLIPNSAYIVVISQTLSVSRREQFSERKAFGKL